MNFRITGKNIEVTEGMKSYIEKKAGRLERFFAPDIDVNVTFLTEKNEQIAEIHINYEGVVYRAEVKEMDLYASIDKAIDILEGQARKTKSKKEKQNRDLSAKEKAIQSLKKPSNGVEGEIIKSICYDIKPKSIEDAKLLLKGKPNDQFLVFINTDTSEVNVVYRTKDGKNFGIVEPE
jgi:ribosomal subunit interface protein